MIKAMSRRGARGAAKGPNDPGRKEQLLSPGHCFLPREVNVLQQRFSASAQVTFWARLDFVALCTMGYLIASLASTHWIPEAPPPKPSFDYEKCL